MPKIQKRNISESENNARLGLNSHLTDIKNRNYTSFSHHFNQLDYNYKKEFKFNILLNSPKTDLNTRKAIKSYFISIKNKREPFGMNIKSSNNKLSNLEK
jgi:hypothetical protein